MSPICSVALLSMLVTSGVAARADELPTDWLVADAPARVADDAPRLIRTEVSPTPQRSAPGYRTEFSELSYRWWTRGEQARLGVGLGSVVQLSRPTGMLAGVADPAAAQWSGSATSLLLGVRFRTSERSVVYADASIGHSFGAAASDPVVGKVGLELKNARSRWDIAYGGLGLRFAGDSSMSLRLRRGGVAVNWRQTF